MDVVLKLLILFISFNNYLFLYFKNLIDTGTRKKTVCGFHFWKIKLFQGTFITTHAQWMASTERLPFSVKMEESSILVEIN